MSKEKKLEQDLEDLFNSLYFKGSKPSNYHNHWTDDLQKKRKVEEIFCKNLDLFIEKYKENSWLYICKRLDEIKDNLSIEGTLGIFFQEVSKRSNIPQNCYLNLLQCGDPLAPLEFALMAEMFLDSVTISSDLYKALLKTIFKFRKECEDSKYHRNIDYFSDWSPLRKLDNLLIEHILLNLIESKTNE